MQFGSGGGEGNCLRHWRIQRNRLNTVEAYNPTTNTWTEEATLLVGKSEISAGLIHRRSWPLGALPVVESRGTPRAITPPRTPGRRSQPIPCTATALVRGPSAGTSTRRMETTTRTMRSVSTESFNLTKNTWTTLTSMPQAVTDSGSRRLQRAALLLRWCQFRKRVPRHRLQQRPDLSAIAMLQGWAHSCRERRQEWVLPFDLAQTPQSRAGWPGCSCCGTGSSDLVSIVDPECRKFLDRRSSSGTFNPRQLVF